MGEPGLVEEVGEERGYDIFGADEAAQVGGRGECAYEVVQEGGVDDLRVSVEGGGVDGDALDVYAEVVVGGDGRKGGYLMVGALGMAAGVLDTGIEGGDGAGEKGAADTGGGDEIRAGQLRENELEHVEIHVHGQSPKKVI